jgi:hypothetical protein
LILGDHWDLAKPSGSPGAKSPLAAKGAGLEKRKKKSRAIAKSKIRKKPKKSEKYSWAPLAF